MISKDYPQLKIISILHRENNHFGFEDVTVQIETKNGVEVKILPYPRSKYNLLNEDQKDEYYHYIKNK